MQAKDQAFQLEREIETLETKKIELEVENYKLQCLNTQLKSKQDQPNTKHSQAFQASFNQCRAAWNDKSDVEILSEIASLNEAAAEINGFIAGLRVILAERNSAANAKIAAAAKLQTQTFDEVNSVMSELGQLGTKLTVAMMNDEI